MQTGRDYRILDKDLSRIGNSEGAGWIAGRPLQRAGLVLGALSLVVFVVSLAGAGLPFNGPIMAGCIAAAYLGLNIGANDVANSAGPAFGAGALPIGLGLAAVAAAQLAGALLAGDRVTHTVAYEIVNYGGGAASAASPAKIMVAALTGAAIWITFANWVRAPVSATHSIVGAVAGAGIVGIGAGAVNWQNVMQITLGWVGAPLISGLLASLILGLLRWRVHFAKRREEAARLWLPLLLATAATIFALYILNLSETRSLSAGQFLLALTLGTAAFFAARLQINRQVAARKGEKQTLKDMLSGPLVITALLSGFAHGANDVANVAGPLTIIFADVRGAELPLSVIGLSGLSIALGSVIFGRRLVRMVGSSITRLNPLRAFCATLAGSTTVLAFSSVGLPVSTTHCVVGGIFGLGFYREWEDRFRRKSRERLPVEELQRRRLVRRSHVWTTLAAWAVTVPASGAVAASIFAIMSLID